MLLASLVAVGAKLRMRPIVAIGLSPVAGAGASDEQPAKGPGSPYMKTVSTCISSGGSDMCRQCTRSCAVCLQAESEL